MALSDVQHAPAVRWDSETPAVTVIVPVSERSRTLDDLYREFSAPLREAGIRFEFVFVVSERWQHLAPALQRLKGEGEPIRILEPGQSLSESAMLTAAVDFCSAPTLLTLPSYPRIHAQAIPRLLEELKGDVDIVSAVRIDDDDRIVNRLQRRLFHAVLRKLVGGRFTDVASGVLAMRRDVLRDLDLYGDSHRFIPILARRDGFHVIEVEATQHAGDRATRVYSPGIYLRRMIDLVGLMFIVRFTYKPLRFFGIVGGLLAASGMLTLVVLYVQRLGGQGMAARPALLLGVLLLVLGLQALAMGLVGEIVVHQGSPRRRAYRILRDRTTSRQEETPVDVGKHEGGV